MFTQNYINYRHSSFMNRSDFTGTTISGGALTGLLDEDGARYADIGSYIFIGHAGEPPNSTTMGGSNTYYYEIGGVYFGSGATPPTKDDYCLESPVSSDTIAVSSGAKTQLSQENGQYIFIGDFIVRNKSDSAVNIQELGCFSQPMKSRGSTGLHTYYLCLMERTVLDEPVTIPAGESRLITYKLVFNQS